MKQTLPFYNHECCLHNTPLYAAKVQSIVCIHCALWCMAAPDYKFASSKRSLPCSPPFTSTLLNICCPWSISGREGGLILVLDPLFSLVVYSLLFLPHRRSAKWRMQLWSLHYPQLSGAVSEHPFHAALQWRMQSSLNIRMQPSAKHLVCYCCYSLLCSLQEFQFKFI